MASLHHRPHVSRREQTKQENEAFMEQLKPFPNLFNDLCYADVTRNRYQSIKDRLEAERGEEQGTVMERARDCNLRAFVAFQLKDVQAPMTETDDALREDEFNLVSNAYRAVFLWHRGNKAEAREQVDRLQSLQSMPDYEHRKVNAKAEVAYSYSRMGPNFIRQAMQLFEEVVRLNPAVKDWKLGLAMSLRRSWSLNAMMCDATNFENRRSNSKRAIELLLEVKQSDAPASMKGLAAAELGWILSDKNVRGTPEMDACCQTLTALDCYREAEELSPLDATVLAMAGKFYMYTAPQARDHGYRSPEEQIAKAQQAYKASISVRPTSRALQGLGKLFSCQASNSQNRRQGRGVDEAELQKRALHCYRQAVDISHGEDTTSLYHMGSLLNQMGRRREALDQYELIINRDKTLVSPLDQLKAYTHAGLTCMERGNSAINPNKGVNLLLEAVRMENEFSKLNIRIKSNIIQTRNRVLLDALRRDTSSSAEDKRKKEARFHFMTGNYKTALQLLGPECQDYESAEIELDCYINNNKWTVEASVFLGYLESTDRLGEFREKNSVLPVIAYSLAARERLMEVGTWQEIDSNRGMAWNCFLRAVDYKLPAPSTAVDQEAEKQGWHVTILHDPDNADVARKAVSLKRVLRDVCGLQVTCMSDDVHPGCDEWSGTLQMAERCRLLVVMVDGHPLSEEFLQAYISPCLAPGLPPEQAAPCTLVLQTGTDDPLPRQLTAFPSCVFPAALHDKGADVTPFFSPDDVSAVCLFFCRALQVPSAEQYLCTDSCTD